MKTGWRRIKTYQRLWVCACSVYPLDQVGDEQHACRQGTRDAEALRQAGTQAGIRLARRLLQDKVTALRETPFWWRLRIGLWWSTACGTLADWSLVEHSLRDLLCTVEKVVPDKGKADD